MSEMAQTEAARRLIAVSLQRWYGTGALAFLQVEAKKIAKEAGSRVVGRNHLKWALARTMHYLEPRRAPLYRPPNEQSDLEAAILHHWRLISESYETPQGWKPRGPLTQFPLIPNREYLGDFVWPLSGVVLEGEGGVFTGQAHGSVGGILRDIRRSNAAQLSGWVYLRVESSMLRDDPWGTLTPMIKLIARRELTWPTPFSQGVWGCRSQEPEEGQDAA